MLAHLPHVFTTLNLFAGFYSIVATFEGKYFNSAIAILLAIIFDIFDGRLARFTGNVSKFGKEFDSLADMVSFGIAPALLIYNYSLKSFVKMGWIASFVYTACVALRLARFNVKPSSPLHFEGLPSPAGGAIIASTVLLLIQLGIEPLYRSWLTLLMVYFVSYLLVSPVKYPSFKDFKIEKLHSFYFLLLFILLIAVSASNPPLILFILTCLYIALGPLVLFKKWTKNLYKRYLKREKSPKI